MKTKSILTAGALAMLMAACSNEELVNNEQLATNRPLVENLTFTTNFGGDSESRAQFNVNRWVFEDGDKFGAYLMDTWTGAPATGKDAYTFVDYIHTNYPFEKSGSVWSSVAGAPVCEGNYFFAYPFDASITNRGKVYYSVDNKQYAYYRGNYTPAVKEIGAYDPWNTWAENQQYLGYSFVEATGSDVNNLDIEFDPIFANPRFKILNATYSELKVTKMLIRAKEGRNWAKLPTKVQLDPTEFDADLYRAVSDEAVPRIQALQNALVDQQDAYVYEYVVDFGENYKVGIGQYISAVAIMPVGTYPELDVYLFVETTVNGNKGIIRIKDTERPQWNGKTQAGSMQLEMKAGVTQRFTATIETNSIGNIGVEGFTVVETEDLKYVVELMAKDGGIHNLKVTTWGDQVELSQSIYEKLTRFNNGNDAPELGGIKLYIDGTIVIPEGVDANAINRLSTDWDFAETTIINKGTQVLNKDVEANIINMGTITEAEGVNVTIYGDVTNAAGAEMTVTTVNGNVDNKGIVTIATVNGNVHNGKYMAEKDDESVAPVTTATATIGRIDNVGIGESSARNWGVLNLNESDDNTSISNKYCGEINLLGGYVYFITNRGGEVNVVEESKVYGLTNDGGIVNVNDNLTVTNALNNTNDEHQTVATINVAEGAVLKGGNGKINNNVNAVINVTGHLYDNVYNSGLINVIENAIVIVEDCLNNEAGIIDVTRANDSSESHTAKSGCTDMYFRYTVAAETTAKDLEAALKARISNNNYGINPVILIWGANSANTFYGYVDHANVVDVTIDNKLTLTANTRFDDVQKFTVNNFLTVDNNVVLNVKNAVVTVNGEIKACNHSSLKGSGATYVGNGTIYDSTATFEWAVGVGSNVKLH
ncbi:MAG: hypothetical protein E7096_08505 [Bacteroides sp.]|nr:hypothetical protein [Bacteroides sp.]